MNPSDDIANQQNRFTEAVRAFTPVCASRYAKLLPFKDGIIELRQKGASYRLIRELLSTIGVAVAVDTIGNFVREVVEQRAPSRPNRRRHSVRQLSEPAQSSALPTPSKPQFPFTLAPEVSAPTTLSPSTASPLKPPESTPANERPRTRGPRVRPANA
jgi:hypothetical protein